MHLELLEFFLNTKYMKTIVFLFFISIFIMCKTNSKMDNIKTHIDILDEHTIKLLKKQNIKILGNISFIHIINYPFNNKIENISNMMINNILTNSMPVLLSNSKIPEATSLILIDNKLLGLSDGRYVYEKGFSDYNNLIQLFRINKPKNIFYLPEVGIGIIFFQSFNNELLLLPNLQSKELISIQNYFQSKK